MLITRQFLAQITPPNREYTQKFSFNLASWIRKRGRRGDYSHLRVFFARGAEGEPWVPALTDPPAIYLGILDDGYLCGSRLSEIITIGTKAGYWAEPMVRFKHGVEDITERFLEAYARVGKCAIDPGHVRYFDSDRFEVAEDGGSRTCRFCGRVEIPRKVERVVVDTVWDVAS